MRHFLLITTSLLCFSIAQAQTVSPQAVSPTDARIAAARQQAEANPKTAGSFNDLAFAYLRKGRDTQDQSTYEKAGKAIDQALKLDPSNYDARKLRVAVLLGMNQPDQALKLETELNHKVPDDIVGWGLLVDAHSALGNYDQAEKAAQWVLDLRPGSSLGFEKAAMLRELFGDSEGSIEFLDEAIRRTSQNDLDQRSWLLVQKARVVLMTGNTKSAAQNLDAAMRLFPDSQAALAGMAQVRMAEGNYTEASSLLEKRYRNVQSAANLFDWAEALSKAGKVQDAAVEFKTFESQARSQTAQIQLINYYSDTKNDPAEALTLATRESAVRHDSATLAAYAWALYKNGKFNDAKSQMEKALAVGVRNPVYFCHAVHIEEMAKDAAMAKKYAGELTGMPGNSCAADASLQSANEVKP